MASDFLSLDSGLLSLESDFLSLDSELLDVGVICWISGCGYEAWRTVPGTVRHSYFSDELSRGQFVTFLLVTNCPRDSS